MIVRKATAADIAAAFASLSDDSRRELMAAAGGRGLSLDKIEAGMVRARKAPGVIALLALCEPIEEKPGALFIASRGENGEAELAGLTTRHFPAIKRAFWVWAARRFLPEFVDKHALLSRCSVAEGFPAWLRMLQRLGFQVIGQYESGGRLFLNLARPRCAGQLTRLPAP